MEISLAIRRALALVLLKPGLRRPSRLIILSYKLPFLNVALIKVALIPAARYKGRLKNYTSWGGEVWIKRTEFSLVIK